MKGLLRIRCSVVVLAGMVGSFASFSVAGASPDHTHTNNAQADTITSSVTIRWVPDNTAFRGRLRSAANECINYRLVTVYKVRSGPDKWIGWHYTGRRGRWIVNVQRAHGRFYAKVHPHGIQYTDSLCGAARSPTVRVG